MDPEGEGEAAVVFCSSGVGWRFAGGPR